MAVYIVTYDLKEPGQRYDDLIAKNKNYGSWAKLGYSCFLINTNDNAVQVRDNLKLALDPNDQDLCRTSNYTCCMVKYARGCF